MALDASKNPILFSVGTFFSYRIAKRYYHNVHYVWCAFHFDDKEQPPTSNPLTIAKRYIEQVTGGDRHTAEIDANKVGILKGADIKHNAGIITKKQLKEIKQLVALADYEQFLPVLYVIKSERVQKRCEEVDISKRASDRSAEYIISDLQEDEFEIVDLRKLLDGIVSPEDKKAGE